MNTPQNPCQCQSKLRHKTLSVLQLVFKFYIPYRKFLFFVYHNSIVFPSFSFKSVKPISEIPPLFIAMAGMYLSFFQQ